MRQRGALLALLAGGAWLCLAAAPAAAQDRQEPIRPFRLRRASGEVYLRGSMLSKDETVSGGQTFTETDNFFREGVLLRGEGSIYHPNLLDWNAAIDLGLSQQMISINGQDRDSNGRLIGYNLSALVLKEKPVSVRLFADHNESFVNRDFTSPLELEQSRRGLEVLTRGRFPMRLLFEDLMLTEVSELRRDEQHTRHLRFSIQDRADPDRQSEFYFDREVTDETAVFTSAAGPSATQDLPVDQYEAGLSTLVRFGPGPDKHHLGVRLRRLDRKGFFVNEVNSADVNLDLNHTRTFSTFYRVSADRDRTDTEFDNNYTGEIGLRKKIYASLDIVARAIATRHEFLGGEEDLRGGFLDLDYRKQTAVGAFTSLLQLAREWEDLKATAAVRTIRDESVTLTAFTFQTLAQPNLDAGSIVVTNLAKTVIYVLNTDYELDMLGAFTRIRRKAGTTTIGDPETVLVSYTISQGGSFAFTTDHVIWNNRLKLKGLPLAVFYNYRLRDEQLRSGVDPENLDTQTTHQAGVELEWNDLFIGYAHEVRDQMLFPPSVSDRVDARYHRRLSRDTDLGLSGHVERLVYRQAAQFGLPPGEDFLDTIGASARVNSRLRRNLLLRLYAEYLRTEGRENDELAKFGAILEWTFRSIDLTVEARQTYYTQEQTTGTEQAILFYLRRRF